MGSTRAWLAQTQSGIQAKILEIQNLQPGSRESLQNLISAAHDLDADKDRLLAEIKQKAPDLSGKLAAFAYARAENRLPALEQKAGQWDRGAGSEAGLGRGRGNVAWQSQARAWADAQEGKILLGGEAWQERARAAQETLQAAYAGYQAAKEDLRQQLEQNHLLNLEIAGR